MVEQIYVNLPVKDLKRSMLFFTNLGFEFDPKFSDEKAACMIIGEDIYAMLLEEEFFKTFTDKEISDATRKTEVLVSLRVGSRAEVDELVSKAIAAGGVAPRPRQDLDFMHGYGFDDLDGHIWEVFHMKPEEEE